MVQMILARRPLRVGISSRVLEVPFNESSTGKISTNRWKEFNTGAHERFPQLSRMGYFGNSLFRETYSALGEAMAVNSFPSLARGNSKAFISAPTSTTKDTIYIQTSSAMPAPSDP
jgi:hypothetical protein